jgi:Ca2+-binding EF-hand superfamily protein
MGLRSDKEDLKKLQNAFMTFDSNKDGTLTIDEFKQG